LKGLKLEEGLKLEANRAVMDEGIQDEENDDMDEVTNFPLRSQIRVSARRARSSG
jgi:hypothetical protein